MMIKCYYDRYYFVGYLKKGNMFTGNVIAEKTERYIKANKFHNYN